MKTDNFTVQSSLEANYLCIQLDDPFKLDEIAIKTINNDCPDFLIPFHVLEINGNISLKYKLINTIALEYVDSSYTKRDFIKLFLGLINPLIKGNDWFLDYHCFCIDPNYVYVDKMTNLVMYIYVPELMDKNSDEDIFNFISNTFAKFTITDDAAFQVNLYKFFARKDVTLIDLYKMLQAEQASKENDNAVINRVNEPVQVQSVQNNIPSPVPQPSPTNQNSGRLQPVPLVKEAPKNTPVKVKENNKETNKENKVAPASYSAPSNNEDSDIVNQLFGSNQSSSKKSKDEGEKKGFMGGLFSGKDKKKDKKEDKPKTAAPKNNIPKGKVVESNNNKNTNNNSNNTNNSISVNNNVSYVQNTNFNNQSTIFSQDSDVTTVLSAPSGNSGMYLELVYSPVQGAPARIDLNFSKDFILIGRISNDEMQPDVCFSKEFNQIGRKHARIDRRDDKFYIIDLGSKNHTYINGQSLVPNQMYELTNGTEIAFTELMPVKYKVVL